MDEAIIEFYKTGNFIIGICLGMQLFLEESEEFGLNKGLGLIKGKCKKIPGKVKNKKIRVPHITWNGLEISKRDNPLFNRLGSRPFMYFIHSYHCDIANKDLILSYTNYSNFKFCSSFQKNNLIGMQFHPEKSSNNGLKLLTNLKKII